MILDELLINSASEWVYWIAWLRASPTISKLVTLRFKTTSRSKNGEIRKFLKNLMKCLFSQILITPEPLDLWARITVHDITFFVLEVPRDDNEDIPFTDPDVLFDLSLNPPHPCHAIKATDTNMVCTHHQFSVPEHFPVSFLGQFYPDDLITRR